jgi:hypothetical protein
VRVGLLQVVERAVHDELAELRQGRPALQRRGQGRAVVGGHHGAEHLRYAARQHRRQRSHQPAQRRLEEPLRPPPQGDQGRLPLPVLVDPAPAPVVQLVAEEEGQLEIIVGHRIDRVEAVTERRGQVVRRLPQRGDQGRGDRPPRLRERRGRSAVVIDMEPPAVDRPPTPPPPG